MTNTLLCLASEVRNWNRIREKWGKANRQQTMDLPLYGKFTTLFLGVQARMKRPYGLRRQFSAVRLTYISLCCRIKTIRGSSRHLVRAFAGTPAYLSNTW